MLDLSKFDPTDPEQSKQAAIRAVCLAIDVLRIFADLYPNDPTLNDGGHKLFAADIIRRYGIPEHLAIPELFREAFRRQPEPQQMESKG